MTARSQIWRDVAAAWRVPPVERSEDWIPRHLRIPATKETPGPFDLRNVPYVRGVLQEVDRPVTSPLGKTIILRWGARNAKTTTCASIVIWRTKTRRLPGLAMSCAEDKVDELINDDFYPMLEECRETAGDLLPARKRNAALGIQVGRVRIRRGFSGSPATLAGYPSATTMVNEAGKTEAVGKGRNKNAARTEAHSIKLARQRGKLFRWDHLFLVEGTPTKVGECPLSRMADASSTQRRFYFVPCPHCGTFQRLQWSESYGLYKNAGVKWEKGPDGHTEPLLAEKTAWYECVTGCRIDNVDRPAMVRAGVWVAEGQTISSDGSPRSGERGYVITGEPTVDSSDICFDELSSLYSLLVGGWGQLAGEWARALDDPKDLQDFVNSTLARLWTVKPKAADPHVVATRLCVEKIPSRVIPSWAVFLTMGIDAQQQATIFPWVVSAWGPGGRGHKVAHGIAHGFESLRAELLRMYPFASSADQTRVLAALIDSGDQTDVIYDFSAACLAEGINLMPSKGSSTALPDRDQDFRLTDIEDRPGMQFVMVNTFTTNPWLQRILDGITKPSDAKFYSLSESDALDLALIGQLCNGQLLERTTDMGRRSIAWDKVHSAVPDDLRDCVRYSRAAASQLTQHGSTWDALPSRILLPPMAAPAAESRDTPAGHPSRRELRRR